MNLGKILLGILVLSLVLMPVVVAAKTPEQHCLDIESKINLVINLLTIVAGLVGVVMAIVVGIMFMQSSDPSDKDKLGGRLKQLIIGIVIVAVANPLVRLIMGSLMDCTKIAAGG